MRLGRSHETPRKAPNLSAPNCESLLVLNIDHEKVDMPGWRRSEVVGKEMKSRISCPAACIAHAKNRMLARHRCRVRYMARGNRSNTRSSA